MAMTTTRGIEFLLDLPETVALRGGDLLVLEDGRVIEVVAAPEPLIEIRCADSAQMVRIAWHLGNRHLPTQLMGKHLRIRRDHVIEDMVKGLGARTIEIEAPFDPEGGAYLSAPAAHDHDHQAHGHEHHVHDANCGHDHGHHSHSHHDHGHGHSHDHHGHDHHGHRHGHAR